MLNELYKILDPRINLFGYLSFTNNYLIHKVNLISNKNKYKKPIKVAIAGLGFGKNVHFPALKTSSN